MKLKLSFCAGLVALLFSLPACANGSLGDVTKPYLGEYECKSATLGEKDYAQDFSFIRLELKKDDAFTLYYNAKNGQKGQESGTYVYDEQKETLTLGFGELGILKRKFPIKNGEIFVTIPIGNQTLSMLFARK